MAREADVVIVGGGIVGCASAYHSRRPRRARRRRRARAGSRGAIAEELGLRAPAGAGSGRGPADDGIQPHLARARGRAPGRHRVGAGGQPRARRRLPPHGAPRGVARRGPPVRPRHAPAPALAISPASCPGSRGSGRAACTRRATDTPTPGRRPTPSREARWRAAPLIELGCAVEAVTTQNGRGERRRHRARRDPRARGWSARPAPGRRGSCARSGSRSPSAGCAAPWRGRRRRRPSRRARCGARAWRFASGRTAASTSPRAARSTTT